MGQDRQIISCLKFFGCVKDISSIFDGCCILCSKSRHSTCISGLSLERYCARYRSAASLSSSLSLTPGVATDRPVTPNDYLMNSACRGSASQVVPSPVHSTILPSTRTLCTQSWYPEGPRIPRFVTTQTSCSFAKKNDIGDVFVYPHTELLLQMVVDAR